MKTLGTNLKTLKECGIPALYEKIYKYCESYNNESSDLEFPIGDNFNVDLGGPILLAETVEDLQVIQTNHYNHDASRYYSIAERACQFDICEYLDDEKYVYVLMCTHNGGGTTYLIPKELADKFETIRESIKLTAYD